MEPSAVVGEEKREDGRARERLGTDELDRPDNASVS